MSSYLLGSRDTHGDVGTHIMTPSERIRENPRAVLAANFKRIGEALRTLEEYSKLVDVWLAGRYEVLALRHLHDRETDHDRGRRSIGAWVTPR